MAYNGTTQESTKSSLTRKTYGIDRSSLFSVFETLVRTNSTTARAVIIRNLIHFGFTEQIYYGYCKHQLFLSIMVLRWLFATLCNIDIAQVLYQVARMSLDIVDVVDSISFLSPL